jgi:hypothetical protein
MALKFREQLEQFSDDYVIDDKEYRDYDGNSSVGEVSGPIIIAN